MGFNVSQSQILNLFAFSRIMSDFASLLYKCVQHPLAARKGEDELEWKNEKGGASGEEEEKKVRKGEGERRLCFSHLLCVPQQQQQRQQWQQRQQKKVRSVHMYPLAAHHRPAVGLVLAPLSVYVRPCK